MTKIIRTSTLIVLEAWLIGDWIDQFGNESQGFNTFTDEYCDDLREKGKFSFEKVKEAIENLISSHGDDKFYFWDEWYKFKCPKEKNLNILTETIIKKLNIMYENS